MIVLMILMNLTTVMILSAIFMIQKIIMSYDEV